MCWGVGLFRGLAAWNSVSGLPRSSGVGLTGGFRCIHDMKEERILGAVVRFNPFAQMETGFDAAFDDLVRRAFPTLDRQSDWTPAADVAQVGEDLEIALEIPGVAPDAVDVEVQGRLLAVHGHKDTAPDVDGVRMLRRETRRGAFSRVFRLPAHVTVDAVSAAYEAGILTIRVAGANPEPARRKIPVAVTRTVTTPGVPAVEEAAPSES